MGGVLLGLVLATRLNRKLKQEFDPQQAHLENARLRAKVGSHGGWSWRVVMKSRQRKCGKPWWVPWRETVVRRHGVQAGRQAAQAPADLMARPPLLHASLRSAQHPPHAPL